VFLELDPNVFYAKELNFSDENIAAAVVRMTYVTFINVYRGNTEFNFSSRVEVFTHLAEMNDRLVQLGEKPLDYNTNLDVSYEVNTSNTRPRHAKLNQEQRSMIVAIWKKHALAPFHTPVRI
jgi:hypothetical protein